MLVELNRCVLQHSITRDIIFFYNLALFNRYIQLYKWAQPWVFHHAVKWNGTPHSSTPNCNIFSVAYTLLIWCDDLFIYQKKKKTENEQMSPSRHRETTLIDCFVECGRDQEIKLKRKHPTSWHKEEKQRTKENLHYLEFIVRKCNNKTQ